MDQEKINEYKKYRNMVQKEINREKQNYYRQKIEQHGNNNKKLWDCVNEIINDKKKKYR